MQVKWTFILIASMVAVFALQGVLPLENLAFLPSQSFVQPWMFVTSIFLHANLSHLFFNMIALFVFGIYLESRVGSKVFMMIFLLGGIVGNFGYMVTADSPNIPGIGASGAVFGVIGSLAVIAPLAIVWLGFAPMPMIVAAIIYGITEFLGLFVPSNIARGAHLGGLFLGVAYGLYLRSQIKRVERRMPHRIYRRYY
jgi:membrane associated rhomboid family serine protease